jgi:hypothetical protein
MTKQMWRVLVEATQPNRADEQALLEHLTAAVAELQLPPALQERIALAVAEAIRRAWQPDKQPAASVTVAAHMLRSEGGQLDHSWGFFLIEKPINRVDRRIDVLLYPETR